MKHITLVCFATLVACGGTSGGVPPTTANAANTANTKDAEPQTFASQVTAGQILYGEKCASCHGASGQGAKAPALVGLKEGALPLDPPPSAKARHSQFRHAGDVASFAVKNMPPGAAGSLKESEYWSILAFNLHANGVDMPNKLDASNAKGVILHK